MSAHGPPCRARNNSCGHPMKALVLRSTNSPDFASGTRWSGRPPGKPAALTALGPAAAVAPIGAEGAAYSGSAGAGIVPARAVTVVDTTGARDATVGAFALATARGLPWEEAVGAAVVAGTAAVQQNGAALILPASGEG